MPHPTEPVIVRHPEADVMVCLNPAVDYAEDDILFVSFPWAFVERTIGEPVQSVRIESATAAPGEKRTRARSK